ncbi:hypothetical protein HYW18_01015 [Candidatus Uhrbacteria bacterium]|nr:hypothetical protein [Candidatus Uhrbacteria bacterium]
MPRIPFSELPIHGIGLCWGPNKGPNKADSTYVLDAVEVMRFISWVEPKIRGLIGTRAVVALGAHEIANDQLSLLEPDAWLDLGRGLSISQVKLGWGAPCDGGRNQEGFTITSERVALVYIGRGDNNSPALCVEYGVEHPETEEIQRRHEAFSLATWWDETCEAAA